MTVPNTTQTKLIYRLQCAGNTGHIRPTQVTHAIPTSFFFLLSAQSCFQQQSLDTHSIQKRCTDGVTCVVLLCPVLPAHCHPYMHGFWHCHPYIIRSCTQQVHALRYYTNNAVTVDLHRWGQLVPINFYIAFTTAYFSLRDFSRVIYSH